MLNWKAWKNTLEWLQLAKFVGDCFVAAASVKAVKAVLARFTEIPQEWITVIAYASAGVILLLIVWWQQKQHVKQSSQSTVQSASSSLVAPPSTLNLDATAFFRQSYISSLTAEAEKNIRVAAAQNQPTDREGFMARLIGVGLVAYLHDMTWAYIYKSQLLMLLELNRRGGLISLNDAKPYYDKAVTDFPKIYSSYSYNHWISFMKQEQLIIQHPNDTLEITVRGKDFLKYLTHWGRYPDTRQG